MPLFEYHCRTCGREFEALVRGTDTPTCPSCAGTDLERLVSLFAVDSDGTRQAARASSLPRSRKNQFDREVGEREEYERHRH
ncbi:MAG: zinc ribbon domain-containing protein [Acidobacteria bacterium]|nr:zinc ribbon domain-containing protein [Acidobacteriota bacterium]